MKKSVFEIATERMVTLLESGTNPWRKTWSTSTTLPPMNYASKRVYSGINFFLLSMLENPYFMTYKQIEKAGGHLKKGAKSEIVFYWLWTYYDTNEKVTKNENEAVKKIPNLRYYRIFNAPVGRGSRPQPISNGLNIGFGDGRTIFMAQQIF